MPRKQTMKRRTSKKRGMRGGNAIMPSEISATYDIGNYAASQQQAGASVGAMPNLDLINQSGGKSRRRQYGGMHELRPTDIGGSTGMLSTGEVAPQQGGYFKELFKSAVAPFGLSGLRGRSVKRPYMGKSRLSKRLRSHRQRRHR